MYHSQCEEDQYLNDNYFKNKRSGKYIELGAIDGVFFSNTKFYEDQLGWSGVLIEPHPEKFKLLQNNRPNNHLSGSVVSNETEFQTFRYFVDGYCAVSGIEDTLPDAHFGAYFDGRVGQVHPQAKRIMKPESLTSILRASTIEHFDLLSLDVEGHELSVLNSWDFSIPIDIILIEMLGAEDGRDEKCREILINNGYVFKETFKHNEIFVHNSSPYV